MAATDPEELDERLGEAFTAERFPHSVNISQPGSDLRIQLQRGPRYARFVDRSSPRTILGRVMVVAALEDVLEGKVWAAQDPGRRPSKRQKDLADIARILESFPHLRTTVPDDVLTRLV